MSKEFLAGYDAGHTNGHNQGYLVGRESGMREQMARAVEAHELSIGCLRERDAAQVELERVKARSRAQEGTIGVMQEQEEAHSAQLAAVIAERDQLSMELSELRERNDELCEALGWRSRTPKA